MRNTKLWANRRQKRLIPRHSPLWLPHHRSCQTFPRLIISTASSSRKVRTGTNSFNLIIIGIVLPSECAFLHFWRCSLDCSIPFYGEADFLFLFNILPFTLTHAEPFIHCSLEAVLFFVTFRCCLQFIYQLALPFLKCPLRFDGKAWLRVWNHWVHLLFVSVIRFQMTTTLSNSHRRIIQSASLAIIDWLQIYSRRVAPIPPFCHIWVTLM